MARLRTASLSQRRRSLTRGAVALPRHTSSQPLPPRAREVADVSRCRGGGRTIVGVLVDLPPPRSSVVVVAAASPPHAAAAGAAAGGRSTLADHRPCVSDSTTTAAAAAAAARDDDDDDDDDAVEEPTVSGGLGGGLLPSSKVQGGSGGRGRPVLPSWRRSRAVVVVPTWHAVVTTVFSPLPCQVTRLLD